MTQAAPHEAPSALEVVQQNTLSRTSVGLQPVAVQRNEALERFSQVIMYGVALVFIWGGIISLAFAEGASELNFLALLIGGGVSSAMAMFMIEIRVRGGQPSLDQPQGYCSGWLLFHGHWDAVGHAIPRRLAQCRPNQPQRLRGGQFKRSVVH